MDILDSMRAEFDVLNDKLDFIVIAHKEGSIDKKQFDKYIRIDAKREEIDYNDEQEG
jgi:hypothetical protein